MRIASIGHAVFAAILILLGILGLITGAFTTVWQPIPKSVAPLAYLCSFVSLACGMGLLWQRTAAIAARVLLAYFLLWFLLLRVPGMLLSPTVDFWWSAAQVAMMLAAAWVLYVWFATDWDKRRFGFAAGKNGLRIARTLYGIGLIPIGLAHFLYPQNTIPLVPHWLPWPTFWAYFTGGALIAAGVAVLLGVYARLAAALSALEIGMFTVLVWVPIVVIAGSREPGQLAEIAVSAALTAAAWVVADSYRSTPWLALKANS
jgi:uncharacterized membrane protein